jgi:antitoxin component HigA of HigAB toxin-antitoxin module
MPSKKKLRAKAPWIDNHLYRFQNGPVVAGPDMWASLPDVFEALSPVRPVGEDDVRQLWIRAERGTIEDFGDFNEFRNEEFVNTREEFEAYWESEYPDDIKWYHIATSSFEDQRFLFFNHKLALHLRPDPEQHHYQFADGKLNTFLSWLCEAITEEISLIRKNLLVYNLSIEQQLPYEKRTGKILRSTFQDITGDAFIRPDKDLPPEDINLLEQYLEQVPEYDSTPVIPELSAFGFLQYCKICYDANHYFIKEPVPLTPMEQYMRMADMRHGGLTEIDQDSPEAFREWYHSGQKAGAHPWEICRGGNSTHISLVVSPGNNGWILSLAGSSIARVAETVRMAAALVRHGIPFHLRDGKEILAMITAKDFIGIVPDHITPRYCNDLFPREERIIDFMNLPFDFRDQITQSAIWYSPDEVQLL